MRNLMIALLAVAAGCGGDDASDSADGDPSDSADGDPADSSDDNPMPTTVTLSGTTNEVGLGGEDPVAGILIEAFEEGATTPRAMATSDANGAFSITITDDNGPVTGYLKATKGATYLPTYLYPPAPLTEDQADTPVIVLTASTFNTLASFAQGGQEDGMGFIGVAVVDSALAPVPGAVITSTPAGTVRYNGNSGMPSASAMMTSADGRGYVFNLPPGSVTVGATKAGSTFTSHAIQVRADAITLTIVD